MIKVIKVLYSALGQCGKMNIDVLYRSKQKANNKIQETSQCGKINLGGLYRSKQKNTKKLGVICET